MTVTTGSTLGSCAVHAPLGAGARGQVWRARETRLGREGAIEVLPDELGDDEERLWRFEREAKALAVLQRASVARIHGGDQEGDTP